MASRTHYFQLPALGSIRLNFRGPAAHVLKIFEHTDEVTRLSKMRHLGLIADQYTSSQHTRWEYAALQCALFDTIDRLHKGTHNTLGHICIDGTDIASSELLKAWTLLSNYGHCRYTFADERALLNHFRRHPSSRRAFLRQVSHKQLRDYASRVIGDYDYTLFHYALAAWRLSAHLPRYSRLRRPAQRWLALLLCSPSEGAPNLEKLTHLHTVFGIVRKLAIVSLDTLNSHLPLRFDLGAAILGFDHTERRFLGQTVENLLNPIMDLLTVELYTDPQVLARMCSYEVQAGSQTFGNETNSLVDQAVSDGLVVEYTPTLRHFHRQTYPRNPQFTIHDDRRRAARLLKGTSGVHTIVDENPARAERLIDFCVVDRPLGPKRFGNLVYIIIRNVFNVIRLHARYQARAGLSANDWWSNSLTEHGVPKDTIETVSRAYLSHLAEEHDAFGMMRSMIRPVVWSVLDTIFHDNLDPITRGEVSNTSHYGIWMKFEDGTVWEDYSSRIDQELIRTPDSARQNELKLIRDERIRKGTLFQCCCMSRIPVFDFSRAPQERERTDVDGIAICVLADAVIVNLFEGKRPTSSTAKRHAALAQSELKTNVLPLLDRSTVRSYRTYRRDKGAVLTLRFAHDFPPINQGLV